MFSHLNVATGDGSTIVVWLSNTEVATSERIVVAHRGLGLTRLPIPTGANCVGPAQAPCGQWNAQSTPPCDVQDRDETYPVSHFCGLWMS